MCGRTLPLTGSQWEPKAKAMRPTLTTTTDPDLLDIIKEMETAEKRSRASIVEELLLLGIAARRARGEVIRVDLRSIRDRASAPSAQGA